MPVEWLIRFVDVSEKLSEDLDFKSIFWFSVLSIIKVIDHFCSMNDEKSMCYRTEQSNIVFRTIFNRNGFSKFDDECYSCLYEKKCRKIYSTLSKNITRVSKKCKKASENHVGVKRGVKFISLP